MKCLGCQLVQKELPVYVIYEDEWVVAILDHAPYNEGHALILPKQHICELNELNQHQLLAIGKASQLISEAIQSLYSSDGITVFQNGGMFNELNHYHMHLIPRYKDQNFADFYTEVHEPEVSKFNFAETMLRLRSAIEKEKANTISRDF